MIGHFRIVVQCIFDYPDIDYPDFDYPDGVIFIIYFNECEDVDNVIVGRLCDIIRKLIIITFTNS